MVKHNARMIALPIQGYIVSLLDSMAESDRRWNFPMAILQKRNKLAK